MTMAMQGGVLALAIGLAMPAAAQDGSLSTRVPQAHVDAFVRDCAANAPIASCTCIIGNLNDSADGQVSMDMVGLMRLKPQPSKPDVLALLNRHGLRPSQLTSALERGQKILAALAPTCD